jgi:hypothetical protein
LRISPVDLARRFNITPAAVSCAVQRWGEDGKGKRLSTGNISYLIINGRPYSTKTEVIIYYGKSINKP